MIRPPSELALGAAGYRLTGPRRAVADLIAARDGYFTAADLLADARARRLGIGRATVFRALEVLVELGAVERIDVVCSRCGRASDIEDAGLLAVVDDIERRTGYRIDRHRLELFGLCPICLSDERS